MVKIIEAVLLQKFVSERISWKPIISALAFWKGHTSVKSKETIL